MCKEIGQIVTIVIFAPINSFRSAYILLHHKSTINRSSSRQTPPQLRLKPSAVARTSLSRSPFVAEVTQKGALFFNLVELRPVPKWLFGLGKLKAMLMDTGCVIGGFLYAPIEATITACLHGKTWGDDSRSPPHLPMVLEP